MNSDELRALQGPLKAKYKEHPKEGLVVLRAKGDVGDGLSCKVETGRALVVAGLHPATGGDGSAACSGDMLLEALVACAGVTLSAVATALGVELRSASIVAEGDLDVRGTLGVSKDVPVGIQNIRLIVTIESDATAEQLANVIRLTERYCVILQTLKQTSPPTVMLKMKA